MDRGHFNLQGNHMTIDELKAEVKPLTYWVYKGVHYFVTRIEKDTRIQYAGEWHPTVFYSLGDEPSNLTFVRSEKEFLEKFKRIFKD